jgi:hypothetical protein
VTVLLPTLTCPVAPGFRASCAATRRQASSRGPRGRPGSGRGRKPKGRAGSWFILRMLSDPDRRRAVLVAALGLSTPG